VAGSEAGARGVGDACAAVVVTAGAIGGNAAGPAGGNA
jgi:hypothetical protein